jgi:hypothetical protein
MMGIDKFVGASRRDITPFEYRTLFLIRTPEDADRHHCSRTEGHCMTERPFEESAQTFTKC